MSQDATLQPVAQKLTDLDAKISAAAAATARKNTVLLVLAVLLAAGVGFYLYWMYSQISTAVTPQTLAEGVRGKLAEVIETNGPQLGQRLVDSAPELIARVETEVRALPPRMAQTLRQTASAELDKKLPELEAQLADAIRGGLAEADNKLAEMPGRSDEDRIKATLETIAQVYGDRTVQAVDEFTAKYRHGAKDIVAHLEHLADNKGLDEEMQLQRSLLVQFITLADYYRQNSGKEDPMSTSIHSPAANIPGTK